MTDFVYDSLAERGEDFDSDAVNILAYNREDKELFIEFVSGGEYVYSDVEESTYNVFKDSSSLGRFYRNHISGKFTNTNRVVGDLVGRDEVEDNAEPVTECVDTTIKNGDAEAVRDRRYSVKWTNGTLTFEPEYLALGENDAILQWNDALTSAGITGAKIVSVTRYFD